MIYAKQYIGMFSLTKLYVLVTLISRPMHTYAIYQQIPVDSAGTVIPSYPGVKNALVTLLEAGYVATTLSVMDYQHPRQGATYELTSNGVKRLQAELTKYKLAISITSIKLKQLPPWLDLTNS